MKKINLNNLIIAHRGVHDNILIPENSILSFKKSIENNLAIELDVQVSSDGELFVFHDDNLFRMSGDNKKLNDFTALELSKIKLLNLDIFIPKFSEVLDLVNGKVLLDIEIKNTDDYIYVVDKILDELKNYNGDFILKSFNPKIVKYIKKKNKDIMAGLLIAFNYNKKIYSLVLKNKFIIKYCHADFVALNKNLLKFNKWRKLTKKMPVLIWTIKSKDEFSKYKNVSYICDNLPFS